MITVWNRKLVHVFLAVIKCSSLAFIVCLGLMLRDGVGTFQSLWPFVNSCCSSAGNRREAHNISVYRKRGHLPLADWPLRSCRSRAALVIGVLLVVSSSETVGNISLCQCLTTVFVFDACCWQSGRLYKCSPQPPWQVWLFKRKINQLWQFLAVLFHIILMTRILIKFRAFVNSDILQQCFQPSAVIKFLLSYFIFTLADFIHSVTFSCMSYFTSSEHRLENGNMFASRKRWRHFFKPLQQYKAKYYWSVWRQNCCQSPLARIVFSVPILCWFAGVVILLRLKIKRSFVFSVLSEPWRWKQTVTTPSVSENQEKRRDDSHMQYKQKMLSGRQRSNNNINPKKYDMIWEGFVETNLCIGVEHVQFHIFGFVIKL